MDSNNKEKSSFEEATENLKKIIETEVLERKKITVAKDVIIKEITNKKNDYLYSLDKHQNRRMEKINNNDNLLEDALKRGNLEDLKKAFRKILKSVYTN